MRRGVLLVLWATIAISSCASKRKKVSEIAEPTVPGPAILAIEIVDRTDNSTEVRNNTKRTIESALGYGFQGNYYTTRGKKFMIYPYSQHDIPPASTTDDQKYVTNQVLNVQKSVSYKLGATVEPTPDKSLFNPIISQGPKYTSTPTTHLPATLFSTVGQGGQISSFSTNVPAQAHSSAIPVIILRVYSNQLTQPAIYPNLPQSHPYASNLNSVNLQSLLANYMQQLYLGQNLYQQQYYQAPKLVYQTQGYQDQSLGYQPQGAAYQANNLGYQLYQGQQAYISPSNIDFKALEENAANLPTHENYPDDDHTRVIYHGPKGHIQGASYKSVSQGYTQSQTKPVQTYVPQPQVAYQATNAEKYIYVNPNQLNQNQVYYQSNNNYQQADYQDDYQQQNAQYSTSYQEQEVTASPNAYLPTQPSSAKYYNHHYTNDKTRKERSKKSNVGPVQFDESSIEEK